MSQPASDLCSVQADHNGLNKASDESNWRHPLSYSMMYCCGLWLIHGFCFIHVLFHSFFQPAVSRDRTQTGRNYADHHGWEPGSAVQRHPEWSAYRESGLQPSGGPVHQRWAVRWPHLCLLVPDTSLLCNSQTFVLVKRFQIKPNTPLALTGRSIWEFTLNLFYLC